MRLQLTRLLPAIAALLALGAAQPDDQRSAAMARLTGAGIDISAETLAGAALKNQVELVELLLAAGVDPNRRGSSLPQSNLLLATLLSCKDPAADAQQRDRVLDVLLEAGADPNAPESAGMTTLIYVAQSCPGSVVARLLDHGGNVEYRSPQGFSALSMALIVKNTSAAKTLIDHGARLSAATLERLFPEPPEDPELAALVTRARN